MPGDYITNRAKWSVINSSGYNSVLKVFPLLLPLALGVSSDNWSF